MKNYVYTISTGEDKTIHIGHCSDILKAINFYKQLPNLFYAAADFNRLVYVEEHQSKEACIERFIDLRSNKREVNEAIIEAVNADWITLVPGVNFELI